MRNVAANSQRCTARWKRVAGAALTFLVLSTVIGAGLPLFGSEVLAAWKASGDAEPALASSGFFEGLLSFDAPAGVLARLNTQTAEAEQSIRKAQGGPLLTKNWKYTQSPTADALALSLNLYVNALQAEIALANFNNFIESIQTGLGSNPSPLAQFLNNALETFQGNVNNAIVNYVNTLSGIQSLINPLIPASFQPPPIPPASPCTC